MKIYLLNTILIIAFIFTASIVNSQSEKSISPDYSHYLGKDYKWEPDNPLNGSNRIFASFSSMIASVYSTTSELSVMKYSAKHKDFSSANRITKFTKSSIYGSPMAFELNSIYFIAIYTDNYSGIDGNDEISLRLYSCDDDDLEEWKHHPSSTASDMPNNSMNKYIAAYAYGGKVYLVYNTVIEYDTTSDCDNESYVEGYSDIYIDECTLEENGSYFNVDTSYHFSDALEHSRFLPHTLSGFVHSDGDLRLLLSYYVEDINRDAEGRSSYNKGGGVQVLDLAKGTSKILHQDDDYICAISSISGSMKGNKDSESMKNSAFRIQVVYNHFEKHSILRWKNTAHFYYHTYTIDGMGYKLIKKGKIKLHDKMIPKSTIKLRLDLVAKFTPINNLDDNRNNDELSKNIWLMHVDKHGGLWANIFHSDKWKPNPSTYTFSTDLMDEAKYGNDIRKLWTLVGVTEGAPPVSIDWDKWDSLHLVTIHPSTLDFSNTQSTETSITSTFSRTWYSLTGTSYTKKTSPVTGSASFKYTNAYQKMKVSDMSTSLKLESDYYSSKNTQNDAYLIWAIPSVYRIQYAIYPWWDNNLTYSVDSSEALLYYSLNSTLLVEKVSKSQKPFDIQNPNSIDFNDWKVTNPYRDTIASVAGNYSIPPRSISWTNNGPGNSNTFVSTTSNTVTTKQTNEFNITATAGYQIPKVFEIHETFSFDWSYESDVSHSTSISKAVSISMKNLESIDHGSNVSAIYTDAYFFAPAKDKNGDDVNWWYYKYFDTHHPWYITYVVNAVTPITIMSPYKNGVLQNNPTFSWNHNVKEKFEYSILFSNNSLFGPGHTYELPVSESMSWEITDENMHNFAKDSVIYWVVKGKNSDNKFAWSNIHWFIIPKENKYSNSEALGEINLLDFIVYPNPVQGNRINLLFKSGLDSDEINMEVYSMEGRYIMSKKLYSSNMNGSELIVNLPSLNSGCYIVKLTTVGASGVVKMIVP